MSVATAIPVFRFVAVVLAWLEIAFAIFWVALLHSALGNEPSDGILAILLAIVFCSVPLAGLLVVKFVNRSLIDAIIVTLLVCWPLAVWWMTWNL
ncbi:membrane hypothetical protein [Erythrobacter sp. EC-HK427]|nr:membrane hypothetical protein [Erythrobacter sp. EC-HK427]